MSLILRFLVFFCLFIPASGLLAQGESIGLSAHPQEPVVASASAEICDNGLDDDGDGYLDCYDPECDCFSDPECLGTPPEYIAGRLAWRSALEAYPSLIAPLVANLNPQTDNIPEIVVVTSRTYNVGNITRGIHIYRGDGANANQPDSVYIADGIEGYTYWMTHPVIGDLDGDGIPELVVVNFEGFVQVYRHYTPGAIPAMQLWLTSDLPGVGASFESRTKRPQLADFNGDGVAEIFAGNAIFQLDLSNLVNPQLRRAVAGGISLPDGKFHDGYIYTDIFNVAVAADMLSVSDCNGDPDCDGLELVAGRAIYSIDLDPNDGDGIEMKMARNLNQMSAQYNWGDGFTSVADVDLDGTPDVVVASLRRFSFVEEWGMYIWNKNGLLRFLKFPTRTGLGIPSISNIYDDTQHGAAKDYPEIIIDVEDRLTCFNLNAAAFNPAQPWWWSLTVDKPSATAACSVFDFNGDGLSEIVYRDRDNLRIMYGGGAPFPPGVDAGRNWWKAETGVFVGDGYPIVADVDNDGQAEITVMGKNGKNTVQSSYNTFLRVYESATAPWMPCRPLWNQFNYNTVNILDDLRVPAHQQKHWLEFPNPGSGKYPFNNNFSQLSVLGNDLQPGYPLPDATATVDSVHCGQQGLHIRLQVCNQGSATLQDSTPLRLYRTDPTAGAAVQYGTPLFLPEKVKVDSCYRWEIQIPLPSGGGSLWGVLNDDGSLPTPFDLAAGFPGVLLQECDYQNQIFSLNVASSGLALDLGPDKTLCAGKTETLNAGTGFANYIWQDGSTGNAFTVTEPGSYWVDAWDFCGYKFTDTLHVELYTLPIPQLDLGPDRELCPGDSSLLQAAAGFASYDWQDGSVASEIIVTMPGVYVLTAQDACGDFQTDSVVIASGLVPTDGRTVSFYPGQSVSIYGQTYTQPGTFTITRPAPSGCDSVIFYTLQHIVANDPTCDEQEIGCMQYELLSITRSTSNSNLTYRIRVTNHCTDGMVYAAIQLPNGVLAKAPADNSTYTAPSGRKYEVRNPNFSPFYSTRFKSIGGGIANGTSDILEYTLPPQVNPAYIHVTARVYPQVFYEAYLNTFYCPVQAGPGSFDKGRPGLETAKPGTNEMDWAVWPNPTDGLLYVDLAQWQGQPVQIQVLNAQGQLVFDRRNAAENEWIELDLPGDLANGLYYLSVQPASGAKTAMRFVLQR